MILICVLIFEHNPNTSHGSIQDFLFFRIAFDRWFFRPCLLSQSMLQHRVPHDTCDRHHVAEPVEYVKRFSAEYDRHDDYENVPDKAENFEG